MEKEETYQAMKGHGLETKSNHSWFLMQITWEPENDPQAIEKWGEVYNWFRHPTKGSHRVEILDKGFLALNLIGQRTFIIAGQALTNKSLQELSSKITLGTEIQVDLYSATNIFECGNIMALIGKIDA